MAETQKMRHQNVGRSSRIDRLFEATRPELERVRRHSVYQQIRTMADVRCFMTHHVFAVWDFMSLLKALQVQLTCVSPPWRPIGDGKVRRFVNELVLEEESDCLDGRYMSHLEMYMEGMAQAGADLVPIERLMSESVGWGTTDPNLGQHGAPGRFVQSTWKYISARRLPGLAGTFTVGRENLIPSMFKEIVAGLDDAQPGQLTIFRNYLERHIELDGGSHGEMACKLLESVCGDDDAAWAEAERAGLEAIEARLALWDAISGALSASST